MPSTTNSPTQVDGSKLSKEQIAAASDFLTLQGWNDKDPTSKVRRKDIARLLAWYAAIRYQAGANGIGTLETPGRTMKATTQPLELEPEFHVIDFDFRSMGNPNGHL
jgi:hypothetical protein